MCATVEKGLFGCDEVMGAGNMGGRGHPVRVTRRSVSRYQMTELVSVAGVIEELVRCIQTLLLVTTANERKNVQSY